MPPPHCRQTIYVFFRIVMLHWEKRVLVFKKHRLQGAATMGRAMQYGYFSGQTIELGECLDSIFVVYDTARLTATVHGEDGIAHVHSLQRH